MNTDTTGRRQRKDVRRHWLRLEPGDLGVTSGFPATTLSRAIADAAGLYDAGCLLSVTDSALRNGLVTQATLRTIAAGLPERQSAVLALADGRRESPFESRAALLFADAELSGVAVQPDLRIAGLGCVRPDFLIEGRVIVECDGRAYHDDIPTRYADRKRHEALERAGFVVIRLTWHDVTSEPELTLRRIHAALLDARLRSGM